MILERVICAGNHLTFHLIEIEDSNNLESSESIDSRGFKWCPEVGSNHRHKDFQSFALPTELSGH